MVKTFLALAFLALAVPARAVVIEGATPSGNFRSVGVSEDGALSISGTVEISTFVVATGAATSFKVQGTGNTGSFPVQVIVSTYAASVVSQGSVPWIISPSTTSFIFTGQVSVSSGPATLVLVSTDAVRNSLICNQTDKLATGNVNVWLGGASVTTATGSPKLVPGQCYSPDGTNSFSGQLYAASTAPATVGFSYNRK